MSKYCEWHGQIGSCSACATLVEKRKVEPNGLVGIVKTFCKEFDELCEACRYNERFGTEYKMCCACQKYFGYCPACAKRNEWHENLEIDRLERGWEESQETYKSDMKDERRKAITRTRRIGRKYK
jgi:hypothetical protein